jgi:hypothetical protein
MTEMCGSQYQRQWKNERGLNQAAVVPCTFIKGHETKSNHSWFALQVQDQVDKEAERVEVNLPMTVPRSVVPLVEVITSGALDDSLEVILAACHGRKRARHARGSGHGGGK